jgi:hypothetical protein
MKANVASRIATDTMLVSDLITGIKKGEIKIPQFQRRFVWKDEQALRLLDSIASNYPVGSLLLWRTKDKLASERNIGEFGLPETDDMTPTDYVLDGQQRLTVIYSCLGAPENQKGFAAAYDLESGMLIRLPDSPKVHQFPLRRMYQTTELLNYRTALQTLPNANALQLKLDHLINAFGNYRLPVVTLKDLTVEEVCPIFERVNSSGTRLSTYDLMVAATWKSDFDLNDEVSDIQDSLRPKGFEDIDRTTVLKCLSALQLGTIKENLLKTLRDLDNSQIKLLIDRTKAALLRAVDLLSTEFRIYSWDFLSYEALIVIICYIYSDTQHLDADQTRRIREWFWRSAFGERYKVGGENFVSRDLEIVKKYVIDSEGTASNFGEPPTTKELRAVSFRSNVSRSRAFILALAAAAPRNLTNGSKIDTSAALSSFNKKQFHHIYPRAFLKRSTSRTDDNLLINICILAAAANNAVSDSDPNVYLPATADHLKSECDAVFSSNILPKPSEFNYSIASYEDFLDARVILIGEVINKLCSGAVLDNAGSLFSSDQA